MKHCIPCTLGSGILLWLLLPVLTVAAPQQSALAPLVTAYEALAHQTDADEGPGWPDVSAAASHVRMQRYADLYARLQRLPDEAPTSPDHLTRKLLLWRLATLLEGAPFDEDRIPFDNGDGFFNTANYAAATTVLRDAPAAWAWIERLRQLPTYYAAQTDNMRRGIATHFVQPRATAEGILAILKIAADQPVAASPLLKPLLHLPATIEGSQQEALRAAGAEAIATHVKPAQRQMVTFFEQEYIPAARTTLAARSLPNGEAYYAYTVRRSTTLNLTPDQVYAMGEREVQRLHAEMEATARATGFQGSLGEFIQSLRTDRAFYAPDLATYVEKASEIGKRVDALLPRWFGTLPRLTWGIQIKPPELDASSGGYNLGDPEKGVAGAVVVGSHSPLDPLFSLPAWVLHEGVPGHHLQIALGQERLDLPKFRRRDDVTAFVEGWALYAEQLGEEMGVYRTPYEHFGRLSFDMWRACRLMMDVGLHWKGWTVTQAESCLRENTTLPDSVIRYETQRYIAWPAQALAYKVGELHFLALRAEAQAALGPRFDIRAFHDALLDDGPMPLEILEDNIRSQLPAHTLPTPTAAKTP